MQHKEIVRDLIAVGISLNIREINYNEAVALVNKNLDEYSNLSNNSKECPYEAYAVFCIECDRQGLKPMKHKDYLNLGK
jgi:hypothetical protein